MSGKQLAWKFIVIAAIAAAAWGMTWLFYRAITP